MPIFTIDSYCGAARRDADPDLKRQLLALCGRLDRFGGELGLGGDIVHFGRGDPLRGSVEDDAGFGPDRCPPGLLLGQIQNHVNVCQLDQVEHPPPA